VVVVVFVNVVVVVVFVVVVVVVVFVVFVVVVQQLQHDWRSSAGIEFFGSIGGKTKSDVG